MKSRTLIIVGVLVVAALAAIGFVATSGFSSVGGGQDRSVLAKQAVQKYWFDVAHGKLSTAYAMLTSGNRTTMSRQDFNQAMYGFVTNVSTLKAITGKPTVQGDRATVPVTLTSPTVQNNLHAYQHLFWENGQWRISDENGGLSRTK